MHIELKNEVVQKVELKDSLRGASPSAMQEVETILTRIGLVDPGWKCPPRVNRGYQQGGWECGLWASRYHEKALRGARFEGTTPPASIKDHTARLNKFIDNLKGARAQRDEKAAKEVRKAEGKAKVKAKAKASAAEALAKRVEPVHATLEQALLAGQKCPKCYHMLKGTKGCRTCMGEWFEEIRMRGVKPEPEDLS